MIDFFESVCSQEQIYLGMLKRRYEIGKEIGARENSIEIAREMLASGDIPVAMIARYTKLNVEGVEALARGEEIQ